MPDGHNSHLDIPAYVRGARLVTLLLMLLGLSYVAATQVEDSETVTNAGKALSAGIGLDLIGVSSAGAVQQKTTPPASDYFPAGYVNQAKDVEEHIQAF